MVVKIMKHPTEDDWFGCKQRAMVTIGKTEDIKPPTEEWKRKILKARHSPIRSLQFSFYLEIPYWVSTHLARHIHAQPYIKSQRNDRQDEYDRTKAPQDAPVCMIWDVNAEELITVANKRLCRQASAETREIVENICREVIKANPEFDDELVPMCMRENGCNEIYTCGFYDCLEAEAKNED